ncbi:MAG: serine hydrolase [Saprospiraceae bacterium]|nr:serine hydrolase [Saprospiraceae bacterium]
MKKLFFALFILVLDKSAQAQNFNPDLALKLQNKLNELVAGNPITKGVSAGVYVPGQGMWTGASGVSFAGQALTTDMKLGLASNSKLFTAVVMLVLAEKNIITLEDKLSKWLPTYKNVDPNITIRQLLNHTSGVEDMFSTQAQIDSIFKNPSRKWTPQEVLSWIGPKKFAPGAGFYYSNTNYILAGMVADKATGKHISKLIREYILTPLQMNNTYYDLEEAIPGVIAHRWYNSIDYHDTSLVSLHSAVGAAGSLFSTPSDMLMWYSKLMNGEVINSNSLAQMTDFKSPGNYGLGISKILLAAFNKSVWGHGGNTIGYRTRMIYDPCMKVIACGLSNSNPSGVDGVTAILYQVLFENLPACAGAISGNATVCQGQSFITYTVPAILNATSYIWTLPNGFTGSSSTNSITVKVNNTAVSGKIVVVGKNVYGEGAASTLNITVNPMPLAYITSDGSSNICVGGTMNLTANTTASIYSWNTGATTKTINISKGGTYNLTVTNGFGCKSMPASIVIQVMNVPGIPGNISGNLYSNCMATTVFKINKVANASSYTWATDIAGAVVTKVPNSSDTAASISFPVFSSGSIQVTAKNICGSGKVKNLTVYGIPAAANKIFGKLNPCVGATQNYYIANIPGAIKYHWTVPPGTTIISGATTNVIKVLIGNQGGDITVKVENACGLGLQKKITISTPCQLQPEAIKTASLLSIFPNPFYDIFSIEMNHSFSTTGIVQISDIHSKIIWSKEYAVNEGYNVFSVDMSHLKSGLYTLIYITPENMKSIRIVKNE